MINSRPITLTVGTSRKSTNWAAADTTVEGLYKRLQQPQRGIETLAEYLAMKKGQQDELKDVGGFVAGSINGSRRKASNVTGRDVVTLDMDNIPSGETQTVLDRVASFGINYCIYSTRKHRPEAPRLRVLIPTDRTMAPDEYEPIARKLAELIGMGWCDPTTFEAVRMMYWPSCCSDAEYIYVSADAPMVSADMVLGMYEDWRDYSQWPAIPGAVAPQRLAAKQGDPLEKPGIVGAFCRLYDIRGAIERYLPGVYADCDGCDDRLTFVNGSTYGGAVLYEDGKFLYSHHNTDPCSGKLVNAWDLVRLHLFGDLDDDSGDLPVQKLPSFRALCERTDDDADLVRLIAKERQNNARDAFSVVVDCDCDDPTAIGLEMNSKSKAPKPTTDNIIKILNSWGAVKGKIALNEFTNQIVVLGSLPWNDCDEERLWTDTDDSGLRWIMEQKWNITGAGKITDAFNTIVERNRFNPVTDYLDSLEWDGVERLDRLLIDCLGAEDTALNQSVTRKALAAAVARAYAPGTKYDQMVILSGPQGIGKSTLIERLSRGWYNDSITTFEGKNASELLCGVWLVEIAELQAFNGSDTARIKQFISQTTDRFRAAYGRHVSELPRRCVFFGTTNDDEYLRDMTGNRRMWGVAVGVRDVKLPVWDLTPEHIDQIWAEAKVRYQQGEELFLKGELYEAMLKVQKERMEENPIEDDVLAFLEEEVPEDWYKRTKEECDAWRNSVHVGESDVKLVKRDRVCAKEIAIEALGMDPRFMKRWDTKAINQIVANTGEWERSPRVRCGHYGNVRGWKRKNGFMDRRRGQN